jgi:hypothetical protein
MKNKELYDKTIDILVQAYFNDTLQHCDCQCCAVGNLVAANKGIRLFKARGFINSSAGYDENTLWFKGLKGCGVIREERITPDVRAQIECTGYTPQQIADIEFAFEKNLHLENDPDGFKGLMAVIDCLDKIHENIDGEATCQTKQRFQKQLA